MEENLPLIEVENAVLSGFDHNRKLSSQMGSENVGTAGQYALEKGGGGGGGDDNGEKLQPLHLSQTVVHEIINKFTLLLDSASYIYIHFGVHSIRARIRSMTSWRAY